MEMGTCQSFHSFSNYFSSLLLAPRINLVAAVNMVLERTSHVAVKIVPKLLYKFYALSLMRIEGKCDRPVSLEESITLAANPYNRKVISLVRYHLYKHCA